MKKIQMIKVEPGENNNKFYYMNENADGSWEAHWGRVGNEGQRMKYSSSDWDKKYKEKIKKGYQDITHLRQEAKTSTFEDLSDSKLQKFLNTLQRYSKQSIIDNYSVSAEAVTEAQVEKAQEILNKISYVITRKYDNHEVDNLLKELYVTIPRKMGKVKDYVLNGDGDKKKAMAILQREQDSVDNMSQQIALYKKNISDDSKAQTLEEALGIKLEHVDDDEVAKIKKLLGPNSNQFVNAYRVINIHTQKNFEEQKKKSFKDWTKLLWHGSRNENWLSIISKGLITRPTNVIITGSMFGSPAIYMADKAQKSIGYSSLRGSYWTKGNSSQGFLALYDVITGIELRVERHEHWMTKLNETNLKKRGDYDSLFAKGGYDLRNNEYVIYNQNQCTIKYVVEVKA